MIKKFFDYYNEKYFEEFCITLNTMLLICPDSIYFEKILESYHLSKYDFIDELKIKSSSIKVVNLEKKIKRSPHEIQTKSYLWLYYSLYFNLNIFKRNIQNDEFCINIIDFIFKCHFLYLRIIDSDTDTLLYRLENIFQAITRVLEILIKLQQVENEELKYVYFNTNSDLFINFIESINDQDEIKKYSIVTDKKNYIEYSLADDKKITIDTSRKLNNSDSILENIIDIYGLYNDFLEGDLDLSRKKEKADKSRVHATVDENDISESIQTLKKNISLKSLSKNWSEKIEQEAKKLLVRRETELEIVPSAYKQRLRNRAYSAAVAKNNLISAKSYDIPVKSLLREFIDYLFASDFNKDNNDVYKIIFIFGILSAQSYTKTINLLLGKDDNIGINFENHEMWAQIDTNLFAKNINLDYFEGNIKNVSYEIPYLLSLTLAKVKKNIYDSNSDYLSIEAEERYHSYIDDRVENFYKTININTKKIHRVSIAYLRDMGKEDISVMFCTAQYSQNSTAKMAYASINKKTEYYSDYINNLYYELGIDKTLVTFLSLKNFSEKQIAKVVEVREYAGSNLLAKREKIELFFSELYRLIQIEKNEYNKFNYIAIYVRFALSLLAGTRTFLNSANLENISFEFKLLKISEKAETKISGLRMIPLCDVALQLIQFYKSQCKLHGLNENNFYIYSGNKFNVFDVEKKEFFEELGDMIVGFINHVPLNFGRHIFTKHAIEKDLERDHIDAYLGHYSAGLEQFGIYSTLVYPEYIRQVRNITNMIADIYKVKVLS